MATEKINVMLSLRYHGKMNARQFVEQWVTPQLYREILE
jgi:hypothetical protein